MKENIVQGSEFKCSVQSSDPIAISFPVQTLTI